MPLPTDLSYVSSNGPEGPYDDANWGPIGPENGIAFLGLIMGFEKSIGQKNIRKEYLPSPTFLGFEVEFSVAKYTFSCLIM